MLRGSLRRLFAGAFCRPAMQPLFDLMHRASLVGMNFSGGDSVATSGERQVMERLRKHRSANPVPVVIDAGAAGGEWTAEVLRLLQGRVRVYCFEPQRAMFARLTARLGKSPNVALFDLALGAQDGAAQLHLDGEGSTLGSLFRRDLGWMSRTMDRCETITVRRLDNVSREQGITHLDLLKLDIEGAEYEALQGAEGLIAQHAVDMIQFEFNACAVDAGRYFRDFYNLLTPRYRLFRILRNGVTEIDRYLPRHEVFVAANYLAVLRAIQGV
jgi:FkbM family methyltransferase